MLNTLSALYQNWRLIMSKRFIDTNLFNDEWFCDLSKDGKLFFIYFITNCDHAGILRLNKKLFEFQSGIKNSSTVIEELSNRLITLKDGVYLMPKFIKFQYPDFPKSNVNQQQGAIKILESYGIKIEQIKELINSSSTVHKDFNKSYDSDNDSDNVNGNANDSKGVVKKNQVIKTELEIALDDFCQMRKQIRKPITQRGQELIIQKLKTLAPNDEGLQVKILNQSIENGWQGIFPIAESKQKEYGKSGAKSSVNDFIEKIQTIKTNL